MSGTQSTPYDLPGFTLPLNFKPEISWNDTRFPNALDSDDITGGCCGYIFTLRELLMMQIMESITNKPDWDKKVWNEEITNKWRKELSESGKDVTEPMINYIIEELKWKAKQYGKTGIVTAYDPGVVKSDVAILPELQKQLREAVKPLENVPEDEKDYHPRSDMKVVDLVHPSLFPLVYGKTRILRDQRIGADDCFQSVGQGELTVVQDEVRIHHWDLGETRPYSTKFQWLPCNVELTPDGQCRIASYINNLHPMKHRNLYRVIEQILTRTIPLWNISLTRGFDLPWRIQYREVEYIPDQEPEPVPENDEDRYSDEFWERHEAWQHRRQPQQPEPDQFQPPEDSRRDPVHLYAQFQDKGLQIIVKLANIELTPDKPEYEGGAWHIEGQLNERICATAIYYYDSENITDNALSFRHRASEEYFQDVTYGQNEFQFLRVFGFEPDAGNGDTGSQITQDLGSVSTHTGRLLTFPNTLQHRVSPFSLADRSKPGHRKILAFFLIDPTRRIISTANIPPQREDWCQEWKGAVHDVLGRRLPVELQDMVHKNNSGFTPMTLDEAKKYRLEIMDERSVTSEQGNHLFEQGGFSLCEH
ncbi:hypothetical protein BDW59DRAFT_159904 [Aspergillus cavernicola]|uniref:Fe2OG dioxygenase domain-containing protein n=1 Tax=Aspergillus cavernicola TaxID=176166 RepID=A0ABR4IJM4_9EURO